MPTKSFPKVRLFRSRLIGAASGVDPTPDDYSTFEDVTGAEPGDLYGTQISRIQVRAMPDLDRVSFVTRPSNLDGATTPDGTIENPLIEIDDLILVQVTLDGETEAQNIFYGFVREAGMDIRQIDDTSGRYVDRQECGAYSVAIRLLRDRKSQVYGQWNIDPNDVTTTLFLWGGPPPDLGRTVFNPDGKPNMDGVTKVVTAWGQISVFINPSHTVASFWTWADAFRYVLSFYNDETWIVNPDYDFFAHAKMAIRVPDSFSIDGDSCFEALTSMARAAGFDVHLDLPSPGGTGSPIPAIVLWNRTDGRADKHLTLQQSGNLVPLIGEANESDDGTNVKVLRYQPDLDSVESAPVGIAGNDRFAMTLTLYPKWTLADNPAIDISDDLIGERYTRSGDSFNDNDYRNVGRRWSANLDGLTRSGFSGLLIDSTGTDLSTDFGYPNMKRPRKFGPVAIDIRELVDPSLRRPVVEWRVNGGGTWEKLAATDVAFDQEADEIWIGSRDLRDVPHKAGEQSMWDAMIARIYKGGTLDLRITAEIVGDRRLRSIPTIDPDTGSGFIMGRIYDAANRYRSRAISSSISGAAVAMTGFDDQTEFDTFVEAIQESNRPGSGSGQVMLLSPDTYYRVGDRLLGVRGGREISFQHGATGFYPTIIAVNYRIGQAAMNVELVLGDMRRAALR